MKRLWNDVWVKRHQPTPPIWRLWIAAGNVAVMPHLKFNACIFVTDLYIALASHFICKRSVFITDYVHRYLAVIRNIFVCCFLVRYYKAMYKCIYDLVKDECDATASAIYTTYRLAEKKRWLDTKNCSISEFCGCLVIQPCPISSVVTNTSLKRLNTSPNTAVKLSI